jgi:hypothetical protein
LDNSCAYRCALYFPLKKLINQSKNPGCDCVFSCTGCAFFFGIFVGVGIVVGDGDAVSVGVSAGFGVAVGIFVGIRVGILVGM